MSEITPYHNYIVVTPNGDIAGFREINDARNFVSGYYIGKVEEMSDDFSVVYSDYVTDPMQTTEAICTSLGAYEGECVIYDLDSLIENIQKSDYFEEEKVELISKLMDKQIDINVNDYQIDKIFTETTVIPRTER
ncbi:MAG: hypothetical protein SPJ62_08300 [Inconstantimicrobium porci]|uniref:hypothetical protein n=1 Tax=Inconstantimicrobium porci TaxID=2652291 RepID=UPI002A9089F5|nr:hypothetical protein [Inconstantimicrobium porci]MDY5911987.1 hypothetical protein [Inconstantimicrobium porci]